MIRKKFLLITILLLIVLFSAFSAEENLAKFYIDKAYRYCISGQYETSKEMLRISGEYSQKYPEYYYIYNLLLDEKRENNHLKKENADKIVIYFDNLFLIEEYDFLKQISKIYEDVKEFDKSLVYYKRLVSIRSKMTLSDHINFISMLFETKGKPQFELIPEIINESRFYYDSLDFEYYLALFALFKKSITTNNFNNAINKLSSNNYSPEKILYLKVLFYSDRKNITDLYNEYISMNEKNSFKDAYKKKILYNLILKSKFLNDEEILVLLNDWNDAAQNDMKTLDFLKDKRLYNFVNNSENLNNSYIKYTGVRMMDNDEDGEWEELHEFKNGVLINRAFDLNQDGIYEKVIVNYDEGDIKEFYVYVDMNNYTKYTFNKNDKSLMSLERYKDNLLISKLTFLSSVYSPKSDVLPSLEEKNILSYVDFGEYWDDETYKKSKYNKSIVEYVDVDSNNNKIFDKRELYNNGRLDAVLMDNNENGKYEIYEKYSGDTLSYITYTSDEGAIDIDYKEVFFADYSQKYWDYDDDGKYEVSVIEYKSGSTKKLFDINHDGNFEYIINLKDDKFIDAYKITDSRKNSWQKMMVSDQQKTKNKNWSVVSVRDINDLIVPDDLVIDNKNDLSKISLSGNYSGVFYYKGKQYFFKNGIIETDKFSYKLVIAGNKIYLFDKY